MRRLYCESGQAGIKSMGFVNDETQKRLEEIIPQCVNCSYTNLQIRSIVMVFDELASIGEIELLHKVQTQIGQSDKAIRLCNAQTQKVLR